MALPALVALLLFPLVIHGQPGEAVGTLGPMLGNLTTTSVQIIWRDGTPPAHGVVYAGKRFAGTEQDGYRRVALERLTPDTDYTYTFDNGMTTRDFTFHTPPAVPTAFTFAVYGDSRTGVETHRKVVAAVQRLRPRFVINTGDIVTDGDKLAEWEPFFATAAPLTGSLPYYVAAGNHEKNADVFYRLFPGAPGQGELQREWYAVTHGFLRVIVLNSTRNVEVQRDWLEQYLTAHAGEARWTVVAFHYPPFSSSSRNGDAQMRKEWVPVLQRHRVDAVFLGHDHFYERSEDDGIPYIICGGGGAPLYAPNANPNPRQRYAERTAHYLRVDVTATSLRIRMFRLDGTVGDEVLLKKSTAVHRIGARG